MAEETTSQLTDEEKIEKKVKLRRMISYILMFVAGISLVVFVVLAFMTKGNIDTQTTFDTQELRSKLKNIVNLEIRHYKEHGEYAEIKFNQLCREIEKYNPNPAGSFKYSFDPETLIATGMEKDYNNDVNGDDDGKDGLSLSVNWDPDVIKGTAGGNFFWAEEDLAYFLQKKGQQTAQ
jgi:hypothetical protein